MNEFDLIARYFNRPELRLDRDEVSLGIGDDAAVLQVPAGRKLCLSMDTLVAGVHFPKSAAAFDIGRRALAVNLSDLAAMGAEPLCFTLALSLPAAEESWLQAFSDGLASFAGRFNCPLVGGDLTKGPLAITIQVHGLAEQEVKRSGAKPGDLIVLTGSPGLGALALLALGEESHLGASFKPGQALADTDRSVLVEKFYAPEPRLEFASRGGGYLHAAIDVSDGLAADLGHLARSSGVSALIDADRLPTHSLLQRYLPAGQRQRAILFGGDDYELCCAVPPDNLGGLQTVAAELDLPMAVIGEFIALGDKLAEETPEPEWVRLRSSDGSSRSLLGQDVNEAAFVHFH